MNTVTETTLVAAEQFLLLNARLIDRLRFAYHFRGGSAEPVRHAVLAYGNPDGGWGNALEPDLRGAASQPIPGQHGLEILNEIGATDDPSIPRFVEYLESITTPDGGVPFVLPSVREAPHGPWWQTPDDPSGALNPTGALVAQLIRAGLDHPWVARATEFCWQEIGGLEEVLPYTAYALLAFLDAVPDKDRAAAAFERLRAPLLAHVELDPAASGEVHFPLDYAPAPDGFGRRLFDDTTIERHLDALVAAQGEDGGWTVNFPIWTPITKPEWNGYLTVERLRTLRAYRRI
jgi:hypothetical protein